MALSSKIFYTALALILAIIVWGQVQQRVLTPLQASLENLDAQLACQSSGSPYCS